MTDDYLWDRSGPVDPEIAELEAALAPLRMRDPLRAPVRPALPRPLAPTRRAGSAATLVAAALSAAATAALIWAWVRATTPETMPSPSANPSGNMVTIDASVHEPGPVSVGAPAPIPAASEPPTPPATTRPRPRKKDGARSKPAPTIEPIDLGGEPASEPVDPSLPETPSTAQIRDAIASVKQAARACGPEHGAASGEAVVVKISIAGATGLVTSAVAVGDHRGTALGECVANALARAVFPRFRKPSIGVQYPIRMPE